MVYKNSYHVTMCVYVCKCEVINEQYHSFICILSRHMVVCQRPRETQDSQRVIYRKRKVPNLNPLYLGNYSTDFYQIYIFYALHIRDLTYQI